MWILRRKQRETQGIAAGVYFPLLPLQFWPELGLVQCSVLLSSPVAVDFDRVHSGASKEVV